ncbi:MAG: YqhA family protein [Betaproteobacteria bacterium]|nr:YqhA family protein [Betaproteobacteria bacterium]
MIERIFERTLWNSRFVVVVAVVASMVAAIGVFYITTVDVWYAIAHIVDYANPLMSAAERKALHDDTVTHIVEVVDGYLLATVMLIFALGLYELFVSDIDEARGSRASSKILVIETLDDLKTRLAKVILMILVVKLFEHAVKMQLTGVLDLLYLGASIALVGLALYLTHASEGHAEPRTRAGDERPGTPH